VPLAALALALIAPAAARAEWSHPGGIAVAPDGRHVYVTAHAGVLALARDGATGALTKVGEYPGRTGPVEVAADGRSVYVGGRHNPIGGTRALLALARDPGSGTLREVAVTGLPGNATHTADIAVAPDGGEVYATDLTRGELMVFARERPDGALAYRGAAPLPEGIGTLAGMAVSGDGRWLYAAGRSTSPAAGGQMPGWIVRFERLAGGGLSIAQVVDCGPCVTDTVVLSPAGWLYAGAAGPVSLRWDPDTGVLGEPGRGFAISSGGNEPGGAGMVIAPDGTPYGADIWGHRVVQLRQQEDGYELARSYRDGDGGALGLRNLRSTALVPDGSHLYAAAGSNSFGEAGTVATFSRDAASGELRFASIYRPPTSCPAPEVTIDQGAAYTRDRAVLVTVQGEGPPGIEIAASSGFGGAVPFPGAGPVFPWKLAAAPGAPGPTRSVYARFGCIFGQALPGHDTIVLDEGAPRLLAARRVRGARGRRIRVRARDRVSGVRQVQVARKRRRPGRWRPYVAKRRYRVARGKVYVRIRDKAGNRSRWHTVKAAGKGV
jgi:hypothetical protein